LETLHRLAACDPGLIIATPFLEVDVTDEEVDVTDEDDILD